MSVSWATATIADVCEIFDRRGVTPKKLGSDFIESGHRVISAKNIKSRSVNLAVGEQRFVNGVTYRKWMATSLHTDDVLLTSEAPLGEPAYLSEEVEWCLGQRLFCLRSDKRLLDGKFLFHALQSPPVRDDMLAKEDTAISWHSSLLADLVRADSDKGIFWKSRKGVKRLIGQNVTVSKE